MARASRGAVIVLSATAVTLALLDLRGGPVTEAVRSAGGVVMGPLQTVAGALANPAVAWVEGTSSFAEREERAQMWAQQAPAAAQVRVEQRLVAFDALMGLVNSAALTVIPSRVVAYPANPIGSGNVVIDVGSSDGVSPDQGVITGQGVVGRTVETSPGTTDVMLLSSLDSAVGGRFLRTGQACVVVGTGDPALLTVRVIDPIADVQIGDAVLTFGSKDSRPFAPDLPVGLVSAIDSDGAGGRIIRLRPAASLGSLDLVGVVVPPPPGTVRTPVAGSEPSSAAEPTAETPAPQDAATSDPTDTQQGGAG